MKKAILMAPSDNVATALQNIKVNDEVEIISINNEAVATLKAKQAIPFGYKIAVLDIEKNSTILKYGSNVGKCVAQVKKGDLVHVHNVTSLRVILPESVKKEVLSVIKL